METFSILFILALTLATVFQLWLSQRHIRYINQHQAAVPSAFADKISLADHQKAAQYTTAGVKLGQGQEIISVLILLAWTFGGGLNTINHWWQPLGLSETLTGVGVIITFMLIGYCLDLPISIYKTFVHEARFGFNRTDKSLFIKDQILHLILEFSILAGVIWVILTLMQSAGTYWWLWAWVFIATFMVLMMWLFPILIAPLFNKFTPLEEGPLKTTIEALLTRCGFASRGIFTMDGSKRSAHGNAYFTGFGAQKRIVFFDTLLESLNPQEIEAVLAHELGHFKRKHIFKGMALGLCIYLIAFAMIGGLMHAPWFFSGLGVENMSTYMGLLLFMLVSSVFSLFLLPLMSIFSRKHEFEADAFAAENSSAQELINALVKLYQENAKTLTPDPLYSTIHDSHPPAGIRVAHLLKYVQTA